MNKVSTGTTSSTTTRPYFMKPDYLDRKFKEISDRVKVKNRDAFIDAIITGEDYIALKIEDDPEYEKVFNF